MNKIIPKQKNEIMLSNYIYDTFKSFTAPQLKLFIYLVKEFKWKYVALASQYNDENEILNNLSSLDIGEEKIANEVKKHGVQKKGFQYIEQLFEALPSELTKLHDNGKIEKISLFDKKIYDPNNGIFTCYFSKNFYEYMYLWESGTFLKIQYDEFVSLKTKKSQIMYLLVAKFQNEGCVNLKISQFKMLFEITNGYRQSHINQRILIPSIKEINEKTHFEINFNKQSSQRNIITNIIIFIKKKMSDLIHKCNIYKS